MNKYALYFAFVLFTSCLTKNSKREFIGYPDKLLAVGTIENQKEVSLFEFYNQTNKRVSTGNYLNGFRNNEWYYDINSNLIEIKWAQFKDKNLGFETNTFASADTAFYGDSFAQLDYDINGERLSLIISINNTVLKDSLYKKSYKEIVSSEVKQFEYSIVHFDSTMISTLPVFQYSFTNRDLSKTIYSNTTHGFIDTNFVQITVSSTKKIRDYKDILFEGVFTNFFLKGKRLYFPFL